MEMNIKCGIFAVLITIIVAVTGCVSAKPVATLTPHPTTTPAVSSSSVPQTAYCALSDLRALVQFEGAAGTIYGSLTLQNISQKPCQIEGDGFIQPVFEAKNITVIPLGTPGETSLILLPDQKVYSKVHYPNGPQCQGGVVKDVVSYMYKASPNESILFQNSKGGTLQDINVCKTSDNTEIQVWSIRTSIDQP